MTFPQRDHQNRKLRVVYREAVYQLEKEKK
jgi:hypothetical protein